MAATTLARTARPQRRWTTPRTLRAVRLALLGADLCLLLVLVTTGQQQRSAVRSLLEEAAPQITAAQRITAAMADMDADAGRALLHQVGARYDATQAFEADRREEVLALLAAAETTRDEPAASQAIEALQINQGSYERLLQRARDLDEQGKEAGPVYGRAAAMMDQTLLPQAAALERTGREQLEGVYAAEDERVARARALTGVLLLALVAGLLLLQVYLSRRTRRTFNLALVAATLWIGVVGVHLLARAASGQGELAAAKTNALQGIALAWQARSAAHLAFRAQVRAQLHGAGEQGMAERAYVLEADRVAALPAGLSPEQLLNALWQRREVAGFTGALPALLQGSTSSAERNDLLAALTAWLPLRPEAVRSQEKKDATPIASATPATLRHSFDDALNSAMAEEQEALERSTQQANVDATRLEVEVVAATGILALLLVLGLAPRLREYR